MVLVVVGWCLGEGRGGGSRDVRKEGRRGRTTPSFWGQFLHFLYKVLGKRSMQKDPFFKNPI